MWAFVPSNDGKPIKHVSEKIFDFTGKDKDCCYVYWMTTI